MDLQVATGRMILMILALTVYFRVVSAQGVANFTVGGTSYVCESNMICLGQAHTFQDDFGSTGIEPGCLSLLEESGEQLDFDQWASEGIAYYYQPVKLFDVPSNQLASFSTSFRIDVRQGDGLWKSGDGMTFVLTTNNAFVGDVGGLFGIFSYSLSYSTPFKSIVVEFDTYNNSGAPTNDINDNHVSFDFSNITAVAVANATEIGVDLSDESTKYAWLDYNRDTLELEVRVSYNYSRPVSPLLNYTVNLTDFIEEYMWVGFSSAAGSSYSNFYIGNWTFESSGIPPPIGLAPPIGPPPIGPQPIGPPLVPLPTRDRSHRNNLGIIVGISVGVIGFLLVGVIAIAFILRRRSSGSRSKLGSERFADDPMMQIYGMPKKFSYKDLSVATKGFSDQTKLGQGGFGSVYRGVLPASGHAVAVKKIKSDSNQGEKEFMAEASIISRLRHRNLIQLHGWCKDDSKEKYLLVYELMPNGSLDKVLFRPDEIQAAVSLSWEQRFNIVTGTAAAVDYLHQGWKQQVIHRDIKSSNIMLNEEWNAKLGDFGLARLVDHKRAATTTIVAGTYGFIAPEAASSGRFTDKTDVYAFGAVVLEIACGRCAFSTNFPSEEILLVDWVWKSLSEGAVLSTVDKRLVEYDPYWMNVILSVGLLCSHPNPVARPSMRQVVQILAGDVPVPSIPTSKPAPVDSNPELAHYWHIIQQSGSSSKPRLSRTISKVSLGNSSSTRGSTVKASSSSIGEIEHALG